MITFIKSFREESSNFYFVTSSLAKPEINVFLKDVSKKPFSGTQRYGWFSFESNSFVELHPRDKEKANILGEYQISEDILYLWLSKNKENELFSFSFVARVKSKKVFNSLNDVSEKKLFDFLSSCLRISKYDTILCSKNFGKESIRQFLEKLYKKHSSKSPPEILKFVEILQIEKYFQNHEKQALFSSAEQLEKYDEKNLILPTIKFNSNSLSISREFYTNSSCEEILSFFGVRPQKFPPPKNDKFIILRNQVKYSLYLCSFQFLLLNPELSKYVSFLPENCCVELAFASPDGACDGTKLTIPKDFVKIGHFAYSNSKLISQIFEPIDFDTTIVVFDFGKSRVELDSKGFLTSNVAISEQARKALILLFEKSSEKEFSQVEFFEILSL